MIRFFYFFNVNSMPIHFDARNPISLRLIDHNNTPNPNAKWIASKWKDETERMERKQKWKNENDRRFPSSCQRFIVEQIWLSHRSNDFDRFDKQKFQQRNDSQVNVDFSENHRIRQFQFCLWIEQIEQMANWPWYWSHVFIIYLLPKVPLNEYAYAEPTHVIHRHRMDSNNYNKQQQQWKFRSIWFAVERRFMRGCVCCRWLRQHQSSIESENFFDLFIFLLLLLLPLVCILNGQSEINVFTHKAHVNEINERVFFMCVFDSVFRCGIYVFSSLFFLYGNFAFSTLWPVTAVRLWPQNFWANHRK